MTLPAPLRQSGPSVVLLAAIAVSACSVDSPMEPDRAVAPPNTEATSAVLPGLVWQAQLLPLLPGGTWSHATAINDQGVIVGYGDVAGGATHAFKYANGVLSDLGTDKTLGNSYALGMNDVGDVVGYVTRPKSSTQIPVRWLPNGTIKVLVTARQFGAPGRAIAINNAGIAVGTQLGAYGLWNPMRWNATGIGARLVSELNTHGEARAINDAGDIVGFEYVGYRWSADGTVKKLVMFDPSNPMTWVSGQTRYYDITQSGVTAAWVVIHPAGGGLVTLWEGILTSNSGEWGGSPAEPDFSLSDKGRMVTTILSSGFKRAITNKFAAAMGPDVVLPLPPNFRASAGLDVNACGQAVGWVRPALGAKRAVLWTRPRVPCD